MTRKSTKSPSAVERLLEQQHQYQDWLEKLHEEAAGAAPSHVAQRVAADYAARLEEVTVELSKHEDGVRQALAEAEARSEGLTKQHATHNDELAEARLRRQVGEYDDSQYEQIASRCKIGLSELSKELAAVERDIDRFEEVLDLIKGQAAAPAEPAALPESPPAAAAVPAPGEVKVRPFEPARARTLQPQMDLDEMAFLRSLTESGAAPKSGGVRVEHATPKLELAKPEPARAEPAAPEPAKAEAPRLETPAEPKKAERPQAPPPVPPPPPPAPAAVEEPKQQRPPEIRESEGGAKTLVCTECGTKNLPSEWYCAKCGAELAPY